MLPWLRGAKPKYENQESETEEFEIQENESGVDFVIENQESETEEFEVVEEKKRPRRQISKEN